MLDLFKNDSRSSFLTQWEKGPSTSWDYRFLLDMRKGKETFQERIAGA